MTAAPDLEALSNTQLLASVRRLTARSNVTLADLLAHLGEVEARGIHRERSCASLYTYCIYELRMSEDAAYRRAKAARLLRDYPDVYEAVAKGQIHLTGLLLIGPYLGTERHREVLERARHRTKREILRLIAEIDPKPEVASRIEPLGPALIPPLRNPTYAQFVESLAGPVRGLEPGDRPADWIEEGVTDDESPWVGGRDLVDRTAETNAERLGAASADAAGADVAAPARPLRYKVQFTADQDYVDLVEEAFDLFGHDRRRPDLPELHRRALRLLVEQLKRRKRAAKKEQVGPERRASSRAPTDVPQVQTAPERKAPWHAWQTHTAPERSGQPVGTDAMPEPMHEASAAGPLRQPELARNELDAAAENQRRRRHVPAAVRRAVWARDDDRCAYVDDRGCLHIGASRRCLDCVADQSAWLRRGTFRSSV